MFTPRKESNRVACMLWDGKHSTMSLFQAIQTGVDQAKAAGYIGIKELPAVWFCRMDLQYKSVVEGGFFLSCSSDVYAVLRESESFLPRDSIEKKNLIPPGDYRPINGVLHGLARMMARDDFKGLLGLIFAVLVDSGMERGTFEVSTYPSLFKRFVFLKGSVIHHLASDLGVDVARLVAEREEARKRGDFAAADAIRETLAKSGVQLMDTPEGVKWERRGSRNL